MNDNIPNNAIITVAGTVGVGKSTMARALADALGFKTSLERVDDNPYLSAFYHDFERWAFHLQIYFLAERFQEQKRIFESGGGYIQDRSIYEDTGIFAKMQYDNGNMSETDFRTYSELFEAMVMTPYFPHPDVLIYLEGTFDDIVARIHERGRPAEAETSITYWKELYDRYVTWIEGFNLCPVIRFDIKDYDLMTDKQSIRKILARVSEVFNDKKQR